MMIHRLPRALPAALIVISAASCARPASGALPATPPELIGCSAYAPPPPASPVRSAFVIEVTVAPDGTVVPGSPHRVMSETSQGGQGAELRALEIARSCTFHPARRDGTAVEGRATVHLRFDN